MHSSRVGTTTRAAGYAGQRSARSSGGDALQQRHAESEGLAHAGAGLTDQVVAGQRQRQGQFLDGERALFAVFGECAHDLVADSEVGE